MVAIDPSAGEAALAGKVLIDVSNPLDFSRGMPPTLDPVNTDSLALRGVELGLREHIAGGGN